MKKIIWTEYLQYRSLIRGYDLSTIEQIIKYSQERYFDTESQRLIAIGKHNNQIAAIPYEESENFITPITIHLTTRQQINFRIRTGRYTNE